MTCGNCVRHVTEELTALPGVTGVRVDLVAGGSSPVVVTSDVPLTDEAVAVAVDEAGYAVTPRRSLL
jgi:copper chaperone CopZ